LTLTPIATATLTLPPIATATHCHCHCHNYILLPPSHCHPQKKKKTLLPSNQTAIFPFFPVSKIKKLSFSRPKNHFFEKKAREKREKRRKIPFSGEKKREKCAKNTRREKK
jgi:hypothetical protein